MGEPVQFTPAIVPPDAEVLSRALWRWMVPGAKVLMPVYPADPLKDDTDWVESERESQTRGDWDREYDVDFTVFAGKPVFEREFRDHLHFAKESLPYLRNRPIIRGWDIPGPLACVWMQLQPVTSRRTAETVMGAERMRLVVLSELYAAIGVADFCDLAKQQGATQFPEATQFMDWCDPAAWQENAVNDKRSAAVVAREHGIILNPGPVNLIERLEPLRSWLKNMVPTDLPSQPPGAILFDPSCTMLRDGLRSGYHYAEVEKSGRYKEVPEKNEYSHPMDALMMGVARVSESMKKPQSGNKPLQFGARAVLGAR